MISSCFLLRYKTIIFFSLIFILTIGGVYPSSLVHATISDGANAIDALGQEDGVNLSDPQPSYSKAGVDNSPNRQGLNLPTGAVFDTVHHRFFLADSVNNRVLVYNLNSDNTFPDRVPDNVLGQATFNTNTATITQSGMSNPQGLAYDSVNDRLFVAQVTGRRVTVYDVTTITNGQNAINVLGQTDFTSSIATTTQSGMNSPVTLAYATTTTRLFVGDSNNRRVTVFNVASITNGQNAINVLGQANFTASGAANTTSSINVPSGLAYDNVNDRLFVAATGNNRVTVFDVSSTTDGQNAINVLGQTTFTGTSSGNSQTGMNAPRGLVYDSATNKLFVAQSGNHRVTVYNVTSTISNGQAAVNILGQPTFASTTATTTQAGINNPQGLAYDSTNKRLFVVQSANSRVSVFNVTSITDGQNAVDLLGQYDGTNLTDPQPLYTKAGVNDSPNRYGFNSPNGILLDAIHHRFFVADRSNNRVLVYNLNSDNTFPDRVPDNVLGQTTFNTNVAATTQAGMTTPVALAYDSVNDRLFVAQDSINRITVYDVSSITNGQNAINVLGQNNFVSSTSATTQAGMKVPTGLAYDTANSRLFVADSNNFRVLIYNVTTTITDGQNATNVLGQSNFTSSAFSISQSSVTGPSDVAYDNIHNRLFVSQSTSNRVTVFDVTNVTDGQNAVNILGQTDFISNTPTTTQSGMTSPAKIAYDSKYNRLFVAQYPNRRVTVFDVSSITDGQNAMNVLGQTDFISKVSTTTQSGMNTPYSMTYDSAHDRLFVDDFTNNRITVYDAAFAPGFTVVETAGSTTSTEGGATDAFTVVLNSQPVTNVVLTLSSSAPDSVTTSPSILTFTSSTWNIPQTIIVSAPEDSNTTNETATLTVAVTTAMSDSQYSSVASQMITVTITDNDTAGGGGGGVITYGGGGPGVVYGCTDKSALNYNPLAFLVDGSCRYTASAIPTTSTLNIPTTTPALPIVREGQLFCTTTPYLTKDIRYGGKNNPEDVRMLETFLNTYEAADLPVDGIYSQKDMAAVIKWQEKYAAEILAPWKLKKGTGIISVTSLKKIRQIYKSSCEAVSPSEFTLCIPETAVLKRGTRGEAVYAAQTILYRMSFLNTLPNGIFGPVTEAAVKLFQTSFGISRSGIVGTLTRAKLNQLGCGI